VLTPRENIVAKPGCLLILNGNQITQLGFHGHKDGSVHQLAQQLFKALAAPLPKAIRGCPKLIHHVKTIVRLKPSFFM
jgi:hypothetical protein